MDLIAVHYMSSACQWIVTQFVSTIVINVSELRHIIHWTKTRCSIPARSE